MWSYFKKRYHSAWNGHFPDWKDHQTNRGYRLVAAGYRYGFFFIRSFSSASEHNITGRATQFQIRTRAPRIFQLKWISKVQSVARNQRTDAVQVPPSRKHSWKLFTYTLLTIIIPAAFVHRPMSNYKGKAINLMSIINSREPLSSYTTGCGSWSNLYIFMHS